MKKHYNIPGRWGSQWTRAQACEKKATTPPPADEELLARKRRDVLESVCAYCFDEAWMRARRRQLERAQRDAATKLLGRIVSRLATRFGNDAPEAIIVPDLVADELVEMLLKYKRGEL